MKLVLELLADKKAFAAGGDTVAMSIDMARVDFGSYRMLAEAAAAGIVARTGLAELVDTVVVPKDFVELADSAASVGHAAGADIGALDTAG